MVSFPVRKWLSQDSDTRPWAFRLRSSKTFIYLTVAIATFTDLFLYGAVVPVLPYALRTRVGLPDHEAQKWVSILLAVYGGSLLAASPFTGYLADRMSSRRTPLLLGLLALAGSTVLLCVGRNVGVFVVGRILQGISAAVVWSVGLALMADTADTEELGQVMGYVGLAMSLGLLLAPLLGGVVYANAGYTAVFAMAFGVIGLDVILRLAIIERRYAAKWLNEDNNTTSDVKKSNVIEKTMISEPSPDQDIEIKDESQQTESMDHELKTNPEESTSAIEIPVVKHPRTRLPPIISLIRSRRLLSSLWAALVQSAIVTGFDSTLPLFVRDTFGWGSTNAGLIFLPIVIPTFVGPIVGWAVDKYGPRWAGVSGLLLVVPFCVCLRFVTKNTIGQKVVLCVLLAGIGLAMTLIIVPMLTEITYIVDAKERARPGLFGDKGAYAQAYALFNMAYAGGALVGPILAGMIRDSAGWGTMTWVMALISGLTAIPVLFWAGGSLRKSRESVQEQQASTPEDVV